MAESPPESRPAPVRPDVAAAVRCWRRARGLTQKQLAVGSHLPRTYISRIENGRIIPGLVTLERVATALDIGLAALLVSVSRKANGNGNGNGSGSGPPKTNGNGNGHGYVYASPAAWPDAHPSAFRGPDACLRELLRYSGQLSGGQRRQVLIRVRELAAARLAMSH